MLATNSQVTPAGFNQFHIPEKITKELSVFGDVGSRKVRLSSNWLELMGFKAGDKHSVDLIAPHSGLSLKTSVDGTQKVYRREYKHRRNNPLESQIEIASQKILDAAIPSYTERLHFTISRGEILIRPLPNRTFSIRKSLKDSTNPFQSFVALTAGVDAFCLEDAGFTIDTVLEIRPPESRDNRDLTETGALNILANTKPRIVLNEDISTIDWDLFRETMRGSPPIAVLHLSLPCDDYSSVKANSLKQRAMDDLSTSRDLYIDALRLISEVNPAMVLLEQVVGFGTSAEGEVFSIKLRRAGYYVTDRVMKANAFGGKTGRERYYLVASIWPTEFEWPQEVAPSPISVWEDIQPFIPACRDITHTKSLHDGIACGRARLIKNGSQFAPTILKSQFRQAKDSVFIDLGNGTYRFPSLDLLQYLQGIPTTFSTTSASSEIAAEIIGQSIDYPMHHKLIMSLKKHISDNVGNTHMAIIKNTRNRKAETHIAAKPIATDTSQLQLI